MKDPIIESPFVQAELKKARASERTRIKRMIKKMQIRRPNTETFITHKVLEELLENI